MKLLQWFKKRWLSLILMLVAGVVVGGLYWSMRSYKLSLGKQEVLIAQTGGEQCKNVEAGLCAQKGDCDAGYECKRRGSDCKCVKKKTSSSSFLSGSGGGSNPASVSGFSQDGQLRVYVFRLNTQPTRFMVARGSESYSYAIPSGSFNGGSKIYWVDTDLDVSSGDTIQFTVWDDDGKAEGWISPSGNSCDGANISNAKSQANDAADGEPIEAIQCWSDSGVGDTDFNDFVVLYSYANDNEVGDGGDGD
ncbi:hypothetical protein ACFL18_02755, partial [Patescibacteria group bacterium]